MRGECATRYPVLLLHGLAYRDDMLLVESWGRIPARLQAGGCKVFLGELEAWSSIENNASRLVERVRAVLAETGADKVNLVGHSKGGLEARHAISQLGLAPVAASLTTICTPHHGTFAADVASALTPSSLLPQSLAIDLFARLMGDHQPESEVCLRELTVSAMKSFNRDNSDQPGVCYLSYGTQMMRISDDPVFALTYELLKHHDGANDGMVPIASCQWGEFRGIIPGGDSRKGISHLAITDFRQRDVAGIDIPGFYAGIVRELKERGF